MSAAAFVYGTLMSAAVRNRVLCGAEASAEYHEIKNSNIQPRSAVLKRHRRHALKGRDYPAVVCTGNDKDEVRGLLVRGLHPMDVKRLDAFEGPEYERCSVQVLIVTDHSRDSQELVDCDVYLWAGNTEELEVRGWTLDGFLKDGKQMVWLQDRCELFNVDELEIHQN